jgi:hypothetical protein
MKSPEDDRPDCLKTLQHAMKQLNLHLERDDDAGIAHWQEQVRRLQLILRKEARDAAIERRLIERWGRQG